MVTAASWTRRITWKQRSRKREADLISVPDGVLGAALDLRDCTRLLTVLNPLAVWILLDVAVRLHALQRKPLPQRRAQGVE